MAKIHKKPTGNLSVYKITGNGKEEIKIDFPAIKSEQEIKLVELFLQQIKTNELINYPYDDYEQNDEQDLDFTIINQGAKSLLELTELIPGNLKAGYNSVSPFVNQDTLAQRLINIIEKKSKNYSGIKVPIDLLVYVTDNNSNISIQAEKSLKIYLKENKHVFRYIFYFIPMFEINDGIIIQYFPNTEEGENNIGKLGDAMNLK
jgi:hypothetical protein